MLPLTGTVEVNVAGADSTTQVSGPPSQTFFGAITPFNVTSNGTYQISVKTINSPLTFAIVLAPRPHAHHGMPIADGRATVAGQSQPFTLNSGMQYALLLDSPDVARGRNATDSGLREFP